MYPSPSVKDLNSILSSDVFTSSLSGLSLSLLNIHFTCLNVYIIYFEERSTLHYFSLTRFVQQYS